MWSTQLLGASLVAQLVKNLPANAGFDPWIGKILWRRKSLPTPVCWPGEFHGLYRKSQTGLTKSQTWLSDFCFHFSHKGFSVVSETEVDVCLEFPYFLYDPLNVGNLISGSSAFSKSSLYIWKFWAHTPLKASLKDFEHICASMWNKGNCMAVGISLALPFFGTGMKTYIFQSCSHCQVFQICWCIECSTFTASSFRIWNNTAGTLSPALALFAIIFSKAHLTSYSRMSGSQWISTPSWLSGSLRPFFCIGLLCILATSS